MRAKMLHTPKPDALQGLRDRAILYVLFYTGCRVSEVTTLKVKDFFEDAGYWVLDFVVKGGQRNRLAIHHELQLALRTYLARAATAPSGRPRCSWRCSAASGGKPSPAGK